MTHNLLAYAVYAPDGSMVSVYVAAFVLTAYLFDHFFGKRRR